MRLPDLFGIRRRRAELVRLRRIAATRISLLVEEWGPVDHGPFRGGHAVLRTSELVTIDAEGAYLVAKFGGYESWPGEAFSISPDRNSTIRLVFGRPEVSRG